jgi:rfaE bifunctional protein nucleotidyltransferase chain/domain
MILIASDHNGVQLKAALATALSEARVPWIDFGPVRNTPSTDYTAIASQVSEALAVRILEQHADDKAILICGTGVGMSIVANKIAGVRAALVHNHLSAVKSREHNDANTLCLGAWVNCDEVNVAIAMEWLSEVFGGGRHVRRVEAIDARPHGKIVFCNGVFDILHKGHIEMLSWAKSLGDKLVVAINTDASTRYLKGPDRPINSQEDRKAVLQALKFVDEVIVFEDLLPNGLIKTLKPNIIVRGGEFTAEEVRKRDHIPETTDVKIYPLAAGYSTSALIEKVRAV